MVLSITCQYIDNVVLIVAMLQNIWIEWRLFARLLIVLRRQTVRRVKIVAIRENRLIIIGIWMFGERRIEVARAGMRAMRTIRRPDLMQMMVFVIFIVHVFVVLVIVVIEIVFRFFGGCWRLRRIWSRILGIGHRFLCGLVRFDSFVIDVRYWSFVFMLFRVMSE